MSGNQAVGKPLATIPTHSRLNSCSLIHNLVLATSRDRNLSHCHSPWVIFRRTFTEIKRLLSEVLLKKKTIYIRTSLGNWDLLRCGDLQYCFERLVPYIMYHHGSLVRRIIERCQESELVCTDLSETYDSHLTSTSKYIESFN